MITADLLLRYKVRPRSQKKAKREAPKPPSAIQVRYFKELRKLLSELRAIIQREVAANLPELTRADAVRLDAPVNSARVSRLITAVREQAASLITAERVRGMVAPIGKSVAEFSRKEVSRVLNIPLSSTLPEAQLERFQRDNLSLIQSVVSEQIEDVEQTVIDGQLTGKRAEDIASDLEERFGVSESRAALIARDQVLKLNADVSQARMQTVGVTEYIWKTSRDARVRDNHAHLDGQRFSFNNPPVVDRKTGRRENPGKDYQCRCTASPILNEFD